MRIPWAVPVMQAPIGPATTPELVRTVSRLGALGTLAASWTGRSYDEGAAVLVRVGDVAAANEAADSGADIVIAQRSHSPRRWPSAVGCH